MSGAPLALADTTNFEALALSPSIGWLMLACAICAALMFSMHADKWRRWWMTPEDPRSIAVFRIVFTFFTICNINGMWECFEFLYTDEGIFTTDAARHIFARHQFAGYGDGFIAEDPVGFYDLAAVWRFLQGPKYSLLFFWDSPSFFWAHLVAFEVAAILFMIGFRTRFFGVLTWFLMNSILLRNQLAWEGTDLVYRCMLAYLILARSGQAYSVDNWLRCRRLRKQGRLSEREGPGGGAGVGPSDAHPKGLSPIYRLIPSWPRKLIMLQLATLYLTTGAVKTGGIWMRGDSLYFALNLDHFYRLPPQFLASLMGTHVFRAMTWTVKVGQVGFSLVILGLVTRWIIAQKFRPLSAAKQLVARLAFGGLLLGSAGIIYVAYPVHFTPPIPAAAFAGLWLGLWVCLWLLWRKLGVKPFVVRGVTIDRSWVCRWIIGRRVMLVWHLAFHAHIITLMNVGQFQTGMMACTFAFLEGREIATLMRDVGHALAKVFPRSLARLLPASVVSRAPILPAADPTCMESCRPEPGPSRWAPGLAGARRDLAWLPDWALYVGLGGVVLGISIEALFLPTWDYRLVWLATFAALTGVMWWRVRETRGQVLPAVDPETGGARAPWAYGPFGRLFIGGIIIWHLCAVAVWLMPDKDCIETFRAPAHAAVATWMNTTNTSQGWGMFAPNPPQTNVFMKVLVTDQDGEVWDLRTDVYAPEQKPIPWIWNTRQRKINRRIIGGESGPSAWYRKWYGRYECRRWAKEHGGQMPERVELRRVWYKIPTPEQTRDEGYYIAEELLERTGAELMSYTARCSHEVMGQLPNFIRERHELPLLEPGVYKPWEKGKRKRWDQRKEREEAKEAKKQAERAARRADRSEK